MKHIVEADADVGRYMIFEPAIVHKDFATANANGGHDETVKELQADRKLILIQTDGGGGTLHAYLDETPPDNLSVFIRECDVIEPFVVHGRTLHFSEVRGHVHQNDAHLPTSGDSFSIDAGTYHVRIMQMDISRQFSKACFAECATRSQLIAFSWINTVMIAVTTLVLCCIVSLFFLSWVHWFAVMGLIAFPAFVTSQFWFRSTPYQGALRVWEKTMRNIPDLIATFEPPPAKN